MCSKLLVASYPKSKSDANVHSCNSFVMGVPFARGRFRVSAKKRGEKVTDTVPGIEGHAHASEKKERHKSVGRKICETS